MRTLLESVSISGQSGTVDSSSSLLPNVHSQTRVESAIGIEDFTMQYTDVTSHVTLIASSKCAVTVIYVSPGNVFPAHISLGMRVSPHTYH